MQLSEIECKIQALEAENQVLKQQEIEECMHRGEESLVKTGEKETVLDKVQYCFVIVTCFPLNRKCPVEDLPRALLPKPWMWTVCAEIIAEITRHTVNSVKY